MGYDLYGLNPQQNTPMPAVLTKYNDENGWTEWNKMSDVAKKIHFEAQDKYQDENPGEYFRANVWWWRPIWNFVCASCEDIMTDNDMNKGCSNSGEEISKTKSNRIAGRLFKLDKAGIIQTWEDEMMVHFKKAEKHNKKVRKKMTAFQEKMKKKHGNDIVPAHYPEKDKKKWEKIYAQEDWTASYPPSRKAIVNFAKFCRQSGGFSIC